jgi:hypothetical protein
MQGGVRQAHCLVLSERSAPYLLFREPPAEFARITIGCHALVENPLALQAFAQGNQPVRMVAKYGGQVHVKTTVA